MTRVIKMVATIVLILCCFLAVVAHRGTAGAVVAGLAVAGLLVLLYVMYREKRSVSALPRELARLAYRNHETTVEFVWEFRRDKVRRVRILRSETGFARSADSCDGQVRVYEGDGDHAFDRDLVARRSYFYTLFVERGSGRWATPVRQEVMMLSAEERASVEESYRGHRSGAPGREGDGPYPAVPYAPWYEVTAELIPASAIASGLSALATDAIFTVADIVAGGDEPEEWLEEWQEIT